MCYRLSQHNKTCFTWKTLEKTAVITKKQHFYTLNMRTFTVHHFFFYVFVSQKECLLFKNSLLQTWVSDIEKVKTILHSIYSHLYTINILFLIVMTVALSVFSYEKLYLLCCMFVRWKQHNMCIWCPLNKHIEFPLPTNHKKMLIP